jgi:hypothetical protein
MEIFLEIIFTNWPNAVRIKRFVLKSIKRFVLKIVRIKSSEPRDYIDRIMLELYCNGPIFSCSENTQSQLLLSIPVKKMHTELKDLCHQ